MTQFYIVEIQEYDDGSFGHIVHFAYDDDARTARLKAESKYHEVLAAAAVSALPTHSAIMFDTNGFPQLNYSYSHRKAPEPEPTEPAEE